MMEDLRRYSEYAICKRRGHEKSNVTLASSPMWFVCKYCGTHFRYETKMIEQNIPKEIQPDRIIIKDNPE